MSQTKQRKNKESNKTTSTSDAILEPTRKYKQCARCYLTEDTCVNYTRFKFSCEHKFHFECYEMMRLQFRGSWCPICFHHRRFDKIQQSVDTGNADVLKVDVDHQYGVLCSELYYDSKTKGNVWTNIEQRSEHGFLMKLGKTDIERYKDYGGKDRESLVMKAKHVASFDIKQETVNKIRKLFDDKKPVQTILAMKYTTEDIIIAGITMEYMIQREYTLKDIYDLGFRTFQDLLRLKMHSRLATLFYEGNQPYVSIQMLVDYYRIDYQVLIKMFCYDFNGNIKTDPVSYQKAVLEFCKLNLQRDELLKLKMNDINALIACFGPNCFTAECMVEFCSGDGVNDIDVLMDEFMFDADTMKKISGFNEEHFTKMLEWDKNHPLRKAVQLKESTITREKSRQVVDHTSSDDDRSNSFGTDTSGSDDGESSGEGDNEPPIPIPSSKPANIFNFEGSSSFIKTSALPAIHASPFAASSSLSPAIASTSYDTDYGSSRQVNRRPTIKREKLT